MLRKKALGFLMMLLGITILMNSCESCIKKDPPDIVKSDTLSAAQLAQLKKIFLSIPSPAEMATLIQEKGYQYDQSLIVPTINVDKYAGEVRQAIMLGVYGADLSYASIFKEDVATMEYFAASEKLARQLQINDIITGELLDSLKKNQDNREAMLNLVSQVYADMNDYIKEKQRYEISALIVSGGWLEGLYLSTLYAADGTQEIRQRIADQKYPLNDLITYLDRFGDLKSIQEIKADLIRLKDAYNSVEETKGKTTIGKDQSGTMVIGTTTRITMDDATLANITSVARAIRTKYVTP